jgi:5-methylcytosine-specific restriction enzyme A
MPSKPLRPCTKQGCNNLTRDAYCEVHQQLKEQNRKQRNKDYNITKRDPVTTGFYKTKAWELVRKQVLIRDHGLCQHCLKDKKITVADMVDHIVPVKVAWHLRLVLSNLQSLCNACHNRKTANDVVKYGI